MTLDPKDVAKKAIVSLNLKGAEPDIIKSPTARVLLLGFFIGIIEDTNTIGQPWVAQLLNSELSSITQKITEALQDIVASGMCSEGQMFSTSRAATLSR